MTSGSRGWSRFGSLAVARAALAVVALALIAVACTQASAQTPTPTPTLAVSIDASGTDLVSNQDAVTLTAVVTNAPENGTAAYKWETRSNTNSTWMVVHPGYPHNDPELRWMEASAATIERDFRVTVSYGTEAEATSDSVTVTWTPPANVPTPVPCTVTTTVSKPTGLAAKVNPTSFLDGTPISAPGILLTYDAPPAGEKVFGYNIYRRVQGESTTLTLWGNTYGGVPNSGSHDTMEFADEPAGSLVDGKTYDYAIAAERWDNCGNYQESAKSDSISVTYTAPAAGDSGGNNASGGL